MKIEYEAKFLNVDSRDVRERLTAAGAQCMREEYEQRRWVFDLPPNKHSEHAFVRVRDEGGTYTVTYKRFSGEVVDHPEEIELSVDSFENAVEMLEALGCAKRSYQINKREIWNLDGAVVTIDTWPLLEPYVELEAESEDAVRSVAARLGFDWATALFCGVTPLYKMKYGEHAEIRTMPILTFDMQNPF